MLARFSILSGLIVGQPYNTIVWFVVPPLKLRPLQMCLMIYFQTVGEENGSSFNRYVLTLEVCTN